MKSICLALLVALSLPGCSQFTASGRMDRAYYKHLKQVKKQREKRRKDLIARQRAEVPSLPDTSPPLQMQTVQSPAETQ